jgi:hypothetical protein
MTTTDDREAYFNSGIALVMRALDLGELVITDEHVADYDDYQLHASRDADAGRYTFRLRHKVEL